jgi:hypothetical protein
MINCIWELTRLLFAALPENEDFGILLQKEAGK